MRSVFFLFVLAACTDENLGLDSSVVVDSGVVAPDAEVDASVRDAAPTDAIAEDTGLPDAEPLLDSGCTATATAASFEYRMLPEPGRPRHSHAAARLPDGRVILAGGFSDGLDFDPDVELFDPSSDTISEGPPRPFSGAVTSGVTLADGRLFLLSSPAGPTAIFDATEWTRTATAPDVFPAVLLPLPDGRVLAIGGFVSGVATDDVNVYDPAADTWSHFLDLSRPRGGADAVMLADGRVLVMAGGEQSELDDTSEFIDVAARATTPGPNLAEPRIGPQSLLLLDRRVLVIGGEGINGRVSEIYNPATNSFEAVPGDPQRLVGGAIALLCDGRVVQVGGRLGSNPTGDSTAWTFDPSADRWRPTSARMPTRQSPSATLLLDGRVLVFGGSVLGNGAQPLSAYILVPDVR